MKRIVTLTLPEKILQLLETFDRDLTKAIEKLADVATVICEESEKGLPGLVSLIGIESPGLTASLAIAKKVEELISSNC